MADFSFLANLIRGPSNVAPMQQGIDLTNMIDKKTRTAAAEKEVQALIDSGQLSPDKPLELLTALGKAGIKYGLPEGKQYIDQALALQTAMAGPAYKVGAGERVVQGGKVIAEGGPPKLTDMGSFVDAKRREAVAAGKPFTAQDEARAMVEYRKMAAQNITVSTGKPLGQYAVKLMGESEALSASGREFNQYLDTIYQHVLDNPELPTGGVLTSAKETFGTLFPGAVDERTMKGITSLQTLNAKAQEIASKRAKAWNGARVTDADVRVARATVGDPKTMPEVALMGIATQNYIGDTVESIYKQKRADFIVENGSPKGFEKVWRDFRKNGSADEIGTEAWGINEAQKRNEQRREIMKLRYGPKPPVAGAKQLSSGKWVVADPNAPGGFREVAPPK